MCADTPISEHSVSLSMSSVTPWNRIFLEKMIVTQLTKKSSSFMEPKCSLPRMRQWILSWEKLIDTTPGHRQDLFSYYSPIYVYVLQVVSSLQVFQLKLLQMYVLQSQRDINIVIFMEIFSFSDVACGLPTERFGTVCLLMFPVSFQKWKKQKCEV